MGMILEKHVANFCLSEARPVCANHCNAHTNQTKMLVNLVNYAAFVIEFHKLMHLP